MYVYQKIPGYIFMEVHKNNKWPFNTYDEKTPGHHLVTTESLIYGLHVEMLIQIS